MAVTALMMAAAAVVVVASAVRAAPSGTFSARRVDAGDVADLECGFSWALLLPGDVAKSGALPRCNLEAIEFAGEAGAHDDALDNAGVRGVCATGENAIAVVQSGRATALWAQPPGPYVELRFVERVHVAYVQLASLRRDVDEGDEPTRRALRFEADGGASATAHALADDADAWFHVVSAGEPFAALRIANDDVGETDGVCVRAVRVPCAGECDDDDGEQPQCCSARGQAAAESGAAGGAAPAHQPCECLAVDDGVDETNARLFAGLRSSLGQPCTPLASPADCNSECLSEGGGACVFAYDENAFETQSEELSDGLCCAGLPKAAATDCCPDDDITFET